MSDREFLFHPAAIEEAMHAARWYRERSPQAAKRFVEEVNQVLDRILEAPELWPRGVGGTRKIKLPCFPFLVIYRESHQQIVVMAVAHGRRHPNYWHERL